MHFEIEFLKKDFTERENLHKVTRKQETNNLYNRKINILMINLYLFIYSQLLIIIHLVKVCLK